MSTLNDIMEKPVTNGMAAGDFLGYVPDFTTMFCGVTLVLVTFATIFYLHCKSWPSIKAQKLKILADPPGKATMSSHLTTTLGEVRIIPQVVARGGGEDNHKLMTASAMPLTNEQETKQHGSVLGQHETAPHASTEPEQPSKACTAPAQEPVPHPIVKHRGTLSSSVGTKPPSISAPLIGTTTWYPDPIYKPIKTIEVEAACDSCPMSVLKPKLEIKQREMEPQPVLEPELEPESEQVPEPVPQPESEPVTEVEPEPEPEPIPMLDPIPFDPVQQKPEYEPEPPVEPGLELEPVPELETKPPVPDLEPGLEPEPVPELETKPPVPDLEPGLEQEPVPELETKLPVPDLEPGLEPEPVPELETKPPVPDLEPGLEPEPVPELETRLEPEPELELASISSRLICTSTWYPDPIYKPIKTIEVEAACDAQCVALSVESKVVDVPFVSSVLDIPKPAEAFDSYVCAVAVSRPMSVPKPIAKLEIKQREMEPQPVLEPEKEQESEQVPVPAPEPESEPVAEVEAEPEPEPIPMLDPIPIDPVQQKPEYEPEPPVPDLEPGLEPEPVLELETGPESELELEADPESELELVGGELCNRLSRELHSLPDLESNCSFIVEEEPQEPVTHSEVEALPALQHDIERESEPKQEHPPGRSPSYSYVIDNGYRHPKSESGSDPELKSESEPQSRLSQRPYETSFAGELDPAENPVPEVEPAEPEVNAEQGFKSQSESKPGAESKQESESKPEPQSKPEAELGSKPGSKSESESRSICETKPVPVSEPVLTSEPVKADSPPLSQSHKGPELQQAASLKDEKSDTATAAADMTKKMLKQKEAFRKAIAKGALVKILCLRLNYVGLPRSGKTYFRRRLKGEIKNINAEKKHKNFKKQRSTGIAEDAGHVIISSLSGEEQSKGWSDCDLKHVLNQFIQEAATCDDFKQSQSESGGTLNAFKLRPPASGPIWSRIYASLRKILSSVQNKLIRRPKPAEMEDDMEEIFEALESENWDEVKLMLDDLILLISTDTGGQAEFLDMQAPLVQGPSFNLLFTRLEYELDRAIKMYYTDEEGVDTPEEDSTMTEEELIFQTLSTIAYCGGVFDDEDSASDQSHKDFSQSKVMFVGTFLDIARDKFKKKDELLQQLIRNTEFYSSTNDMIEYASEEDLMLAVDNMHGEDEEITRIRKIIEDKIRKSFKKIDIPVTWLMLSLCIRKKQCRTISLEECRRLAGKLKISPDELEDALWFLHRLGMLLYFPDVEVLRNTIICDMQVLFDSTSNLIRDSRFTRDRVGRFSSDRFKKTAQFSFSDLEKATRDCIKEDISLEELIRLLEHLNILATLPQTPSSKTPSERQFFMACLLKSAKEDELEVTTDVHDPDPLIIHFDCGYVPVGIFPAMITSLVSQQPEGWQISDDLRKNKIPFLVGNDRDEVTLISHPRYFKIAVRRKKQVRVSTGSLCADVRSIVESRLGAFIANKRGHQLEVKYKFGFECPCGEGLKHLRLLDRKISHDYMQCLQSKRDYRVGIRQNYWFTESSDDIYFSVTPGIRLTLKALYSFEWKDIEGNMKSFRLSSLVDSKWRKFGIHLEYNGNELDRLSIDCASIEQRWTTIMDNWLTHKKVAAGYEPSWSGLYKLLKAVQYEAVAKNLKQAVDRAVDYGIRHQPSPVLTKQSQHQPSPVLAKQGPERSRTWQLLTALVVVIIGLLLCTVLLSFYNVYVIKSHYS